MVRSILRLMLVFAVCGLPLVGSVVAEEEGGAEGGAGAEAFAEVFPQWQEVDQQLRDVIRRYRTADTPERRKLLQQYNSLVAQSNELVPRLRQAALAAYRAAPNEDPQVTGALLGMVSDNVRRDDYDGAMELAQVLLDHQCQDQGLYPLVGVAAFCRDDFETAEKYLRLADQAGLLDQQGRTYLDGIDKTQQLWQQERAIRAKEAQADDLPRVRLETSKGPIVIELFENEAPGAVGNFVSLVEKGYYDGLTFHRVLPGFMAQGGCPTGDGTGGPGYHIYCESHQKNHRKHFRGTLSMAHAGRDTGGSQFFLTFCSTPHLDGKHTAFGRVIEGFDVLPRLQRRDPSRRGALPEPDKIVKAEVLRKRDRTYEPNKVAR